MQNYKFIKKTMNKSDTSQFQFKVWDKEYKEFLVRKKLKVAHSFVWVYCLKSGEGGQNSLEWCIQHPEGFEVLQCIGIKDKKQKLIDQGDIIKTPYNDHYDYAYYVIIWHKKEARFYTDCIGLHHKTEGWKDISRGGYCAGGLNEDEEMEVIGNKFENPELFHDQPQF